MNEDLKFISWPGWKSTRVLGKGSYGKVYEIQRDLNGMVEKAALKVISIPQTPEETRELLNSGHSMQSIEKYYTESINDIISEYQIMAKMKGHSNVVSCDDYRIIKHDDEMKWDILIKMELLTPLNSYIQKNGMTEREIIKLGKDMCHALILCSQDNIIHRDIKPQNMFRSDHGDYKLGDFGIAKAVDRTTSGTIIGTYKYMAPEVYFGKPYGGLADMYSLGLVLYWLLNNRVGPFLPTQSEIPSASQELEARRLRLEGNRLPKPCNGSDELVSVVLKACEYEPGDRYRNAYEMLEELEKIEANDTMVGNNSSTEHKHYGDTVVIEADHSSGDDIYNGDTSEKTDREKKKRPIKLIGLSVATLLLLVLIFSSFLNKREEGKKVDPEPSSKSTETVEEGIAKGIYEDDTYVNSSLNLSVHRPDDYHYVESQSMFTLSSSVNENSSLYGVESEMQDGSLYEFAFANDSGEVFMGYKEGVMYREQSPTSYLQSLKQVSKGECSEIVKTTLGGNVFYSMNITTNKDKAVFYVIRKDDDLFIIAVSGVTDETLNHCTDQIDKA